MSIILPDNFKLIFSCFGGSKLYGTSTPLSDTDERGVFIPSEEYFYGFLKKTEQYEDKSEDTSYLEIRKFLHLASQNNPNVIELLWVPDNMYLNATKEWEKIVENRHLFISTKAKFTFSGYAHSQFKRIKNHRGYLLNPPKKKPIPEDFGLTGRSLMSDDDMGTYETVKEVVEVVGDLRSLVTKSKAYKNAKREWDSYENWKKNRNPERAILEEKYGFDVKHAQNLYRLITEGEELLTTGNITFPRPDAEFLLEIRNGKYSYDQMLAILENYDQKFEELYQSSKLQKSADVKKIDELCIKIIKEFLNK